MFCTQNWAKHAILCIVYHIVVSFDKSYSNIDIYLYLLLLPQLLNQIGVFSGKLWWPQHPLTARYYKKNNKVALFRHFAIASITKKW